MFTMTALVDSPKHNWTQLRYQKSMEAHWQNKYLHNNSSSIGQGTPPKGLGKDNITVKIWGIWLKHCHLKWHINRREKKFHIFLSLTQRIIPTGMPEENYWHLGMNTLNVSQIEQSSQIKIMYTKIKSQLCQH